MNRSVVQRLIPIIFIIVIVGLAIAAVTTVVRIISGKSDDTTSQVTDTSSDALLSTTSERKVRMTIRGPIVGDENFRSYQVTVTPNARDFVRYSGYVKTPFASKHYGNNTKAYDEFVHALARANMAEGTQLTGEAEDTRGVCANGQVHEFEILNGENVVKHLWTSTCKNAKGSLVGDANNLRGLFLAQVPDATAMLNDRSR